MSNAQITKSEIKLIIVSIIGGALGLIGSYDFGAFLIVLFSLIAIFLFAFSRTQKKKRNRFLLTVLSLFVLLHLLVFPLCYLFMLKNDVRSITINTDILSRERAFAIKETENRYDPNRTNKRSQILQKILKDSSYLLDSPITYLKNNNILVLDSFLIARIDTVFEKLQRNPSPQKIYDRILICNKKGQLLDKLYENSVTKLSDKKMSLREYFISIKELYENRITKFSDKQKDIYSGKGIWTYTRLLPYIINIFNSENFKPISSEANILHFIHCILVGVLLLNILGAFLYDKFTYASRDLE